MRALILALAFAGAFSAVAGPNERTADLRTLVPDLVAKDKTWGATIGAGATSISGNTKQVIGNFNTALFRRWDSWIAYVSGQYDYLGTGDPLRRLKNLGSATLRGDYLFSPMWRWFAFTTHGYNEFQGLDYRASLGTGPWYQVSTDTFSNGLSLAVVYEFEDFQNGDFGRIGRIALRNVLSVKLSDTSAFALDFFYAPAISDFGDFRLMVIPALDVSIISNLLTLRLYATFERDMRPAPGIENNDLELGTRFSLNLGE